MSKVGTSAYPRRLIEVDLPIARISAHARREKSIRHGHISTLHIWWARRPLAACRSVILASLWPDPAPGPNDAPCPPAFLDTARNQMLRWAKDYPKKASKESFGRLTAIAKNPALLNDDALELRRVLLDFIADFANWDNSADPAYLETARTLVTAAHSALGDESARPLVADPFAGGSSMPLEALRVGADAFASDLNPVAVLLNKVLIEYVPKYRDRLADRVRAEATRIQSVLQATLGSFYGSHNENGVDAFLWARTIVSEAPTEGEDPVEVPLLRSMLLLKKAGRYEAFRWVRDDKGRVRTEVATVAYADGKTVRVRRPLIEVFHPSSLAEVERGTSAGGAATCPVTGFTTPVESVRNQLSIRRGGAADARLIAVIASSDCGAGHSFDQPTANDLFAATAASDELRRRLANHHGDTPLLPNGELNHLRGFFNVVLYGMKTWADLFSPRQALGLITLVSLVQRSAEDETDSDFRAAIRTCLGLALDRCADKNASVVVWDNTRDMATHVFGRQALPMIWDFAEINLLSDNGWKGATGWVSKVIDANAATHSLQGTAASASATKHPLPDDTVDLLATDPPYYSAIPYADLSDFFYSWLKRSVGDLYPDLFSAELSPKDAECVSLAHRAAMYRNKDNRWFEQTMTDACAEGRRITKPSGAGVFVFANKETAGWEAMLNALIESGWVVTASWPIDTEMGNRLRAQNSAVLGSSVHLVCRPRETTEGEVKKDHIGDWRDVLAELPVRIHSWMPRLAKEGIVGADAIFACLGPALEIFSQYSRVEKASGERVPLREYLEHVWAAVSNEALSVIFKDADAAGLEPDARLTAMWLWSIGARKVTVNGAAAANGDDGDEEGHEEEPEKKSKQRDLVMEFDAARKIAQGLGVYLEKLDSLVEIKGEIARLLPVAERTRYLFGTEEQAQQQKPTRGRNRPKQGSLFEELQAAEVLRNTGRVTGGSTGAKPGKTVLDRIHQAMTLFAAGRTEAMKRLLVDDGAGADPRFWRLAQSLSALYPSGTDEKRWVDGVLARKKGLGL